jgi:hypothetical protein
LLLLLVVCGRENEQIADNDIYSIAQARRQRKYDAEQAAFEREQAAKQEALEREQEQVIQEQAQTGYTREQAERARKQAAVLAVGERLYFLATIIVNTDIPRSSRQIFFDEYIAKGGNGSFVKFWYDEGKAAAAKQGTVEEN